MSASKVKVTSAVSDAKCNFDVGEVVPIPTLPSCNTVSASTAVPSSASEKIDKLTIKNPILSMGMSSDYKLAKKLGSNMVRIGSLIFKN